MTCRCHNCEDLVSKSLPTFLVVSLRENAACGISGSEARSVVKAVDMHVRFPEKLTCLYP